MKKLKEIRALLNMDRQEFGEHIGVTKSQISNYENGIRSLPIKRAMRVCELANSHGHQIDLNEIYRDVTA